MGLIFGNTVYAITAVLAVFMSGLASGSALLGRWSGRVARPVALYGWIELCIAGFGAISLVGLVGVRELYRASYEAAAGAPAGLMGLRFLGTAIVLLFPTLLMGGTLPILTRGLARSSQELGARLARLYWVNTLGAVGGTLAAGFLLLPELGLQRTVATAAALNVFAGVLALLLDRRFTPAERAVPSAEARVEPPRFLLGCFAAVGATAMAYEVGWTRLLATMLGSSTYAFTLMLATFLLGIVGGSWLFEKWWRRGGEVSTHTFATTQTLTALAGLLFIVYLQQLPRLVPPLLKSTGLSFGGLILAQLVTAAAAMLPAATVFGFNFPAVTALIARRAGVGSYAANVGFAYAANTLGAIAGVTATGFWLMPWLGAFRLLALTTAVNLALALLLELRAAPRRPLAALTVAALLMLVLGVTFTGAFYNRELITFNPVLYWDIYPETLTLAEVAASTDVVFAEDGLNASVAVVRAEDYTALRTNGKVDASNRDVVTQLLVGHLGMIFHPAPRRVLVIGFGSGMTVSAVARYAEVERVDCVEIEPAVIRAAPYLASLNRAVLDDPRLRVIFDDARNFLLATRETYDLIISEPSNPWIAGVSALFTDEFYREAKARLRPGGLFVQWVQAYSLFPEDLRMVLATFVPHFPKVTLWRGESADLLLLAQPGPEPLHLDRLRALWGRPELRADYERLGMRRPEGLLAFHRLGDAGLRQFAARAGLNTDDHSRLEYGAPRSLLARGLDEKNLDALRQHRPDALPTDVSFDDRNAVLAAAAETMLQLEENGEAEGLLAQLPSEYAPPEVELVRGRLLLARHQMSEARRAFEGVLAADANRLEAAIGLADVARRLLQYDTAELLYRQVLARQAGHAAALEGMAQLESARENWAAAAEWQERLVRARPEPAAADYARLGEFLFRAGDVQGAEPALRAALARDPYSFSALRTLGALLCQRKDWSQAARQLEATVRFHPDADPGAYLALADAYRGLGDRRAARAILRKGLRIFPGNQEMESALSR